MLSLTWRWQSSGRTQRLTCRCWCRPAHLAETRRLAGYLYLFLNLCLILSCFGPVRECSCCCCLSYRFWIRMVGWLERADLRSNHCPWVSSLHRCLCCFGCPLCIGFKPRRSPRDLAAGSGWMGYFQTNRHESSRWLQDSIQTTVNKHCLSRYILFRYVA